jgi:uncharacterized protein (DUF302 family)
MESRAGDQRMISVDYREEGRRHEDFQHLRMTNLDNDTVLARLRSAIMAEDIMVLAEVDAQSILGRSGYAIGPTRQILFFHPRLMARLLAADTSALLEAPLKFSVVAGDAGVAVRWQDPRPGYDRYGNAALTELGAELAKLCERIADAALAAS